MQQPFEQMIDRYGSRLRHLALMLLGRGDEADDVVQDTLIKLWHRGDDVRRDDALPWLLTCTRNACLDRLRHRQRTQSLTLKLVGEQSVQADVQSTLNPDEAIDVQRRRGLLLAALAEMPEPGRSLLILRDMQELDVAQTAKTLELSRTQVKVYTFRARRLLRKKIEEELHEQVA